LRLLAVERDLYLARVSQLRLGMRIHAAVPARIGPLDADQGNGSVRRQVKGVHHSAPVTML